MSNTHSKDPMRGVSGWWTYGAVILAAAIFLGSCTLYHSIGRRIEDSNYERQREVEAATLSHEEASRLFGRINRWAVSINYRGPAPFRKPILDVLGTNHAEEALSKVEGVTVIDPSASPEATVVISNVVADDGGDTWSTDTEISVRDANGTVLWSSRKRSRSDTYYPDGWEQFDLWDEFRANLVVSRRVVSPGHKKPPRQNTR